MSQSVSAVVDYNQRVKFVRELLKPIFGRQIRVRRGIKSPGEDTRHWLYVFLPGHWEKTKAECEQIRQQVLEVLANNAIKLDSTAYSTSNADGYALSISDISEVS